MATSIFKNTAALVLRRKIQGISRWLLLLALLVLSAAGFFVARYALSATLTVTTTSDVIDGNTTSIANLIATPGTDGVISLREAITAVNNNGSGPHTINFNISGCGGVCTISPGSALPTVTTAVAIDGWSQPGWTSAPLIELNGTGAGNANGLRLSVSGNTIRGLTINRFALSGIAITAGADNNTIQGNYIGTSNTGLVDQGNSNHGIYSLTSSNNQIGGTTSTQRNILSGNDGAGLYIDGGSGNTVAGNYVGLGADGSTAVGNGDTGISVNNSPNNVIGGTSANSGNLVSANSASGIRVRYATSTGNRVLGNWIGLAADGSTARGNGNIGVIVHISTDNTQIGDGTSAGRNVISGSTSSSGIQTSESATNTIIQGNYIGTNAAGTAAVANSTAGILLGDGTTNQVGGTTSGQGNLISGNTSNGITVSSTSISATIQGNMIGTNADNSATLANGAVGISIFGGVVSVGGTAANAGNTIRASGTQGIRVTGASTRASILSNRIYGNSSLGIDLNTAGVSANDGAKSESLANRDMDAPVFTSAQYGGGTLFVAGYVGSAANQSTFAGARVEVFLSDNDGTGYGEGQTYLGTLTTDGSGNFSGSFTPASAVAVGNKITATATDTTANNSTSEFSANYTTTAATFSMSGTVFEDKNYAGGNGRNRSTAISDGGAARSAARVELYDNAGAYVSSTTTDGSGNYSFTSLAPGTYTVRVANGTVTSSRTGYTASHLPVQTFRTNASSGSAVDVYDYVGGQTPNLVDAGSNVSSATLASLTAGSATPQSITTVTGGISAITGVDFGYSFNVVVNVNDSGQGSLRQFITNANALSNTGIAINGRTASIDHAVFMISNGTAAAGLRSANNYFTSGVATIAPTSALPTITEAVVIDAQTQPGWTSAPIVELNGTSAGATKDGLTLSTNGNTVRGFIINRFTRYGIYLTSGTSGNTLQGNYVGTDATGLLDRGNTNEGIYLLTSSSNQIGGTSATQRNVVSGNDGSGIFISGGGSNTVQGNYMGLGADGQTALGNTVFGLRIDNSASNMIGGTTAGSGNIISANGSGTFIRYAASVGNTLLGNWYGLAADGTTARGNNSFGLVIGDNTNNTQVGNGTASGRNVLSGSLVYDGINVQSSAANVTIIGNYIGTNAAGTAAIPNQNSGVGLQTGSTNTQIGGTVAGYGNLISGNTGWGIAGVSDIVSATIQGNQIGTNAAGTGVIANGSGGIVLSGGVATVGGTAAGAGNVIRGNTTRGISITGASTRVSVLGNVIYGNGALGIDLGANGVTANNGTKSEASPNRDMDFPVISSAQYGSSTLYVSGYVGSAANQSTFASSRVEFFISDNDGTGYGEGQTYIGTLTADASGNFSGSFTPASAVAVGNLITATATDTTANNSTSEFAANYTVTAAVFNVSGTVFEDKNYAGGSGRTRSAAITDGGSARSAARVELYDNAGAYVSSTTTDGSGNYSFSSLAAGTYTVRVANGTVTSSRTGYTASHLPVQTFRTDASSGAAVDVTDYVGGQTPNLADAGSNVSSATLASLTTGSTTAQSISTVTGTVGTITGIDFGYSFNVIVNTNNSGQGSLRQFMTNANALSNTGMAINGRTASIDHAIFMISNGSAASGLRTANNYFSSGVATIAPTSALPTITEAVVIDAQTQPGWTSAPIIELNGTSVGATQNGLTLNVGGNTLRGLVINRFTNHGILANSGAGNNVIQGNYIGTDATGLLAQGNYLSGIALTTSSNNQIGGTSATQRNVLSSNGLSATPKYPGISISSGLNNIIQGNYIGLGVDGLTALGNGAEGIQGVSNSGTIGGSAAGAGNVISANGSHGISFYLGDASGSQVLGNFIGVAADGSTARGNTGHGIAISNTDNVQVGDGSVGGRNVISGNSGSGIGSSSGTGARFNTLLGNYIGTNAAGSAAVPNGSGIAIVSPTTAQIGGTSAGQGNLVSGNSTFGIQAQSTATIQGNTVGTNAAGSAAIPNGTYGIYVMGDVTLGGTAAGAGNLISGNSNAGILVTGTNNVIQGNTVGLAANGTSALPNLYGVYFNVAANPGGNTVGGTAAGARNVISGNTNSNVYVSVGYNIVIKGNTIGANAAGNAAPTGAPTLTDAGITFVSGANNTVGGTAAGEANLIAYNTRRGVRVYPASVSNFISGNSIYANTDIGIDLGNPTGVTANNGTKSAALANYDMDYPVFSSVSVNGTTLYLSGYVGSAANQSTFANARVEVFLSDNDASGYGEGQTYLGTLTTDASGNFSGSFTAAAAVVAGNKVTGTATDTTASNSTSEFGPNFTVTTAVFSISGTVFEDKNYGGGNGRNRSTAISDGGAARSAARVELYDNAGAYVSSTTTDGSGNYSFSALAPGTYTVRVANGTVTSSRTGYTASHLPVQTFRTNASSGSAVDVYDYVGGQTPNLVDAGSNVSSATLASLTAGSATPQSITTVTGTITAITGVDFGYSFNVVVNVNDSGQGSLRQFITNANALSNTGIAINGRTAAIDHAVFMISNGTAAAGLRAGNNYFSSGIATIAPTSALPTITEAVVIDAQTQPGWTSAPIVELNGTGAGNNHGLQLNVGSTVLRGLIINRFQQNGILVNSGANSNTIQGNYIGTDSTGLLDRGNTNSGIKLDVSSSNLVGGTTTAQRNVISGNGSVTGTGYTQSGIHINNGANSNTVQGNYIGLGSDGATAIGNSEQGVVVANSNLNNIVNNVLSSNGHAGLNIAGSTNTTVTGNIVGLNAAGDTARGNGQGIVIDTSSSTQIGDGTSGGRNVISSNTPGRGIYCLGTSTSNLVVGNYIGTNTLGTVAMGNQNASVHASSGCVMQVGGTTAGQGNLIRDAGGQGINIVDSATRIAILGNSIYGNSSIGIDLGSDGVTANTGTKSESLPNRGMNQPVFTSAAYDGTTLYLTGYVGSAANQTTFAGARVEVFLSDSDGSGYGEGQTYLGYVTTDASGNFNDSFTPASAVAVGNAITATATDTTSPNSTSEFSANTTILRMNLGGVVFEDVNYGGGSGRNRTTALTGGGTVRSGARVELYNNAGAYVTSTTTDSNGVYRFSGQATGTYTVRVVNSTVTSSRSGYTTSQLAVQTFRTNASSGTAVDVTDYVGGQTPNLVDAGSNVTSATLASLTAGSATAQSITTVVDSGSTVANVDFGYSFNVVVNVNDSGQGSLRQFFSNANALSNTGLAMSGRTAGIDHALFMISNGTAAAGLRAGNNYFTSGIATITLATHYADITDPVVIDAQTQPGWVSTPIVELNGTSVGGFEDGISLLAVGNTVRGLVINRFPGYGIYVHTGANNNVIQGNYIGTDATGLIARNNGESGIYITAATGNQIGGSSGTQRNVIAANGNNVNLTHDGITLDSGANATVIQGNYIGLGADGLTALGNGRSGITITASYATIGGIAVGAGNVIGSNKQFGVRFSAGHATGSTVLGNFIGVAANGTTARGNTSTGISISASPLVQIGDGSSAGRNVISGNSGGGIILSSTSGATMYGNYIGTNAAGTAALPNTSNGVSINSPATAQIGGRTAGQGNLISGNSGIGIQANNTSTIEGNYIGTNAAGNAALPNTTYGITASSSVTIGGAAAGAGNLISGNSNAGIRIIGTGNVIQGNTVGLDVGGTTALPNLSGIRFDSATNPGSNTVGGTSSAARNVIAGNTNYNVHINSGYNITVQGNYIGTNASGNAAPSSAATTNGVYLNIGSNNVIGGIGAGESNVIAYHAAEGVRISRTAAPTANSTGNAIRGNSIHSNGALGIDLGISTGVTANDGAETAEDPNLYMDSPVFTNASYDGTLLRVRGYVGSAPNQTTFASALVDVFISDEDGTGYGEGRTYLGTFTADANGAWNGTLTTALIAVGNKLTATATDTSGNTSEFGANYDVRAYAPFRNGSFEDGTLGSTTNFGDGDYWALPVASTSVDYWVVENAALNVMPSTYWNASDGVRSVDLNHNAGPGAISQTFDTEVGTTYSVFVDYSGSAACGPTRKGLRISAAGSSTDVSDYLIGGSGVIPTSGGSGRVYDLYYDTGLFRFTAVTDLTTLKFESLSSGLCGSVIDHVRVQVADPFTNGGFETGSAPGNVTTLSSGSTAINNWVVGGNSINYVGSLWAASEGSRSVRLDGTGLGSVAQTFDALPEVYYRARFALSADPNGSGTRYMNASAGGTTQSFNSSNVNNPLTWTDEAFVFRATDIATTLDFASLDATGTVIDDVRIEDAYPFINGSFEDVRFPLRASTDLTADTKLIRGWVTSGTALQHWGSAAFAPSLGSYSVHLNGPSGAGTISQTFDVEAGQSYDILFDAAADPAQAVNQTLIATIVDGGITTATRTVTLNPNNVLSGQTRWRAQQISFTAANSRVTLSFASQNAGSVGLALDNVRYGVAGTMNTTGQFNAFETSTAANSVTGVIKTKLVGQAFSLDIAAIKLDRTGYSNYPMSGIKIELIDASDDSGALDELTNCRSSWTSIATVTSAFALTGPDNGRKAQSFTVNSAYRNLRVKISYPGSGTATNVGCSNDNFAVRPSAFSNFTASDGDDSTAGTTRVLNNSGANGVVHRAGRPFTVIATAVDGSGNTVTSYDGTPQLSAVSCVVPVGCSAGALAGSASSTSGVVTGNAFTYAEGGSITVQLVDATFADVDSSDSTQAERAIELGSAATLGRFVADRYQLSVSTAPSMVHGTCGAGPGTQGFTFVGQNFGFATAPVIRATPLNAAGVALNNARPIFDATHVSTSFVAVGASVALNGSASISSITASSTPLINYASSTFSFARNASTPVASFAPTFTLTVDLSDTSEPGATAPIAAASALTVSSIGFSGGSGNNIHYGQLLLRAGYADLRSDLYLPLEVQRYTALGWQTLSDAGTCVSAAATAFAYSQATGLLNAGGGVSNCSSRVTGTVTTIGGRASIVLPKPTGGAVPSAMTITLNVDGASGTSCSGPGTSTAATSISQPWLAGTAGAAPSARVSWGAPRSEYLLMRERYD